MSRKIIYDGDALLKLRDGATKLSDTVGVTLGPLGRHVAFTDANGKPVVTKDGFTVAGQFTLADRFENEGVQLVREAAAKTKERVGDGATTTVLLASSLIAEGVRQVVSGGDPEVFVRGLLSAKTVVEQELFHQAWPCRKSTVAHIAMTACGDEGLASLIDTVYTDGTPCPIITETGYGHRDHAEVAAKLLLPPSGRKANGRFDEALLLLWDGKVTSAGELAPVAEAAQGRGLPLCVIAQEFGNEAMQFMETNAARDTVHCFPIRASDQDSRGDWFEDIAFITGGTVYSTAEHGSLARLAGGNLITINGVELTEKHTFCAIPSQLTGKLKQRREAIRNKHLLNTTLSESDKLKERLARLSGWVTFVHLRAASDIELAERRQRFDDAVRAVDAALEGGVLPGGGLSLLNCVPALRAASEHLPTVEKAAVNAMIRVLESPFKRILANAGEDPHAWIDEAGKDSYDWGFNVQTKKMERFMEVGVVNPAKTEWLAFVHAVSIAEQVLRTKYLIAYEE